MRKLAPFIVVVVLGCILLAGCGGSGSVPAAGKGHIRVKIAWPKAATGAKMIPDSSKCVELDVYAGGAPLGSPGKQPAGPYQTVLVPHVAGQTSCEQTLDVPVGDYHIVATAHGTDDASDPAQATGVTETITVDLNSTVDCSLTMGGTVTSIELSPSPLMLYGGLGGTGKITVTAKDASDNVVMLSPSAAHWNISPLNVISIDASGVVTALQGYGYPQVSYTDLEQDVTSNSISVNIAVY